MVSFVNDTSGQKTKNYLREVFFAVDTAGFLNAENHLLFTPIPKKFGKTVGKNTIVALHTCELAVSSNGK